MAARFKKEFIHQTADSDDAEFGKQRSDTESESVNSEKRSRSIFEKAKTVSKQWRKRETGSAQSSSAAAASTSPEPATKVRVNVPKTHPKTSETANEFFKDADASQKVYEQFLQGFTNIQWFARPHTVEACKNAEDICGENESHSLLPSLRRELLLRVPSKRPSMRASHM